MKLFDLALPGKVNEYDILQIAVQESVVRISVTKLLH